MQDCRNGGIDGCETDTSSDVLNCGGCGLACTAGPGLRPLCNSGVCGASSCGTDFAECNRDATDGCETDTQRDPNHCGACAAVCPGAANAAPTCAAGRCKIACQAGYLDCDGDPSNGCEVNGSADITNCGSCKNVCPTGGTGNPACAAGTCTFTDCTAPYLTCKSGPVDSCETNTATSASNCGACGKVCPAVVNGSPTCRSSNCGIGSCNAGFDNCDGMLANGCESSLNTDVRNCGVCGTTCAVANATPNCVAATCGIGSCNAGFDDCDKNPANGCEVNLNSSAAHCNACNAACPMGNICSKGMCQTPPTGQVPGVPIDTPEPHTPLAPWIADVNADGRLDILVANGESGLAATPSGSLSVFFGNGDATVRPEQYYTGATLSSNAVVAADVDGDGWLDAITVDGQANLPTTNGSISVYLNQGTSAPGTFNAPTSFTTGAAGSLHLCSGDFDKDGHVDIATVSVITNQVSVLMGDGAGGFAAPTLTAIPNTGGVQSTIACRDMNGDGFPDIEVTSPASSRLSILINQGDASFAAPVSYTNSRGGQTAGLAFGDVNGNYGSSYIGWGAATCRRSNHGHRNRSDRSDRSEA